MTVVSTPTWSAPHNGLIGDASATAGAAQVNQFLGTHADQVVYAGSVIAGPSQYTYGLGSPYQVSLGTDDVDQPFTMSGTVVGRVQVPVLPVGAGADLLVSLCVDNAGAPGAVVAQTRVPAAWIYQLAPVAGTATGVPLAPTIALTGNPLATSQSSMIETGNVRVASYPVPAQTGVAAASSATWYDPYIVQIGGVNGGAALPNVFTIPYGPDGTLGKSIPQPNFPVNNDGSSASCVALDAQSGTPVVVNSGGGTTFGGAPVATVYTSTLNAATGALTAWSSQAALPATVQSHSMTASGSYVYSLGGKNATGNLATVWFAQVVNAQITGWTATTPLPVPTSLMFVAVSNGFMFAVGGTTPSFSPDFTAGWYAVIHADGSLGQWIALPPLPNADLNLNDNAFANEFGLFCGGATYTSLLPVTASGPGSQWFQSVDNSGNYPGYHDDGTGLVSSGSQGGGNQAAYDFTMFPYISVPLPATGLTGTSTYHVLLQQQGGDLNDYLLLPVGHGPAVAGRTSGRDGYAWTPLPNDGTHVVGVPLAVFNNTPPQTVMPSTPLHLWEDQGARITTLVTATTPDQRLLGVLEATRQAYALNSNQGFESGIAPWTVSGGTVVQSTAQAYTGAYSAQVTPSGSASTVYLQSELLPCMPGQWVSVVGWMWFTSAVTSNASMSINWYTLAGSYISTSFANVSVPAATWTQLSNAFTAPATAYQFAIAPTLSGTPAASQVFNVDTAHAHYTYTGPQNSTVTQVVWSGSGWPNVGEAIGATQLA